MAARSLALQKTLTQVIELSFCGLVSIICRGGKGLFLGKKVPWQLLVLIEDHKRMEVRECYWCINVVHGRVTSADMDLATLWSLWSEKVEVHILGL